MLDITISDLTVSLTDKQNDQINSWIGSFDNAFLGKKAEFLTLFAMNKYYGFPLIKPDLGDKKKYCLNFHAKNDKFPDVYVKVCSQLSNKDYCWTFQDELEDSNNLVALLFIENARANVGLIKAILPYKSIKQLLKDSNLYFSDIRSELFYF